MTTLRESLQSEIAKGKADLADKEAQLARLEATFSDALSRDVDELKAFFHSVGSHLFGHAVPVPAPAVDVKPTLAQA